MLRPSMLKGFLFPFTAKEPSLAILRTSMDESQDGAAKEVFAVGAVIGSEVKWEWLNDEWTKILNREGLAYFRTADCTGVDGEFLKYRADPAIVTDSERETALNIRNELIDVIIGSRLSGVGVAVDLVAFDRIADTSVRRELFGNTPYYHCYLKAVTLIGDVFKNHLPNDFTAFGFDEHEEYAQFLVAAYPVFKQKNPDIAPFMTTLAPFDDRVFIPIQAADLIASAIRRFATSDIQGKNMPKEWMRLRDGGAVGQVIVCDDADLKQHLLNNGIVA
jgi:hypothetical protein